MKHGYAALLTGLRMQRHRSPSSGCGLRQVFPEEASGAKPDRGTGTAARDVKLGRELALTQLRRLHNARRENGEAGLKGRPSPAYSPTMDATADKTLPCWPVESLERSEAQIAAGRTVSLQPLLDRFRASIARMRGKRPQSDPR